MPNLLVLLHPPNPAVGQETGQKVPTSEDSIAASSFLIALLEKQPKYTSLIIIYIHSHRACNDSVILAVRIFSWFAC